jgi:hypothetical protein
VEDELSLLLGKKWNMKLEAVSLSLMVRKAIGLLRRSDMLALSIAALKGKSI